jgi:hypothetical protein
VLRPAGELRRISRAPDKASGAAFHRVNTLSPAIRSTGREELQMAEAAKGGGGAVHREYALFLRN